MRRSPDPPSLAAGVVVMALGAVLLLDRAGAIDVTLQALAPIACAVVGVIVLVSGLSRPR